MTNEQLADHFDQVDETTMAFGGPLHFTPEEIQADPGAVIGKVCGIYKTIRPFMEWASNFFLFPRKIKEVLKTAISLLDTLCPDS